MVRMLLLAAFLPAVLAAETTPAKGNLQQALALLRQVGPNGKGASDAAQAWQQLSRAEVQQVPELLAGMDGASPLARNWIRAAIDRVLEQARAKKQPFPKEALETFLKETKHSSQGRRLAYELLLEQDATTAERFLPTMLEDPSLELRRDAIARLLEQADKIYQSDNKKDAVPLYQQTLVAARDLDQINPSVRRLRDLGQKVDIARRLGFVLDWKLIGPFPNEEQKGVETVYPPEKKIDLTASYEGKKDKVRWTDYRGKDELGVIDLNDGVKEDTNAIAYALAEFTSPEERDVEIRLGCFTVFKLWVNGQLVLARGDAYAGMRFDHYVAKVHLKKGENQILLKLCQDVPPDPLPKVWRFLLRVCDASGGAILSTTRSDYVPPEKKPKS